MPDLLNCSHLKNIARALLLLQICLITWLCSGTRVEHLMPMFYVSATLFTFTTISDPDLAEIYSKNPIYFNYHIFNNCDNSICQSVRRTYIRRKIQLYKKYRPHTVAADFRNRRIFRWKPNALNLHITDIFSYSNKRNIVI